MPLVVSLCLHIFQLLQENSNANVIFIHHDFFFFIFISLSHCRWCLFHCFFLPNDCFFFNISLFLFFIFSSPLVITFYLGLLDYIRELENDHHYLTFFWWLQLILGAMLVDNASHASPHPLHFRWFALGEICYSYFYRIFVSVSWCRS